MSLCLMDVVELGQQQRNFDMKGKKKIIIIIIQIRQICFDPWFILCSRHVPHYVTSKWPLDRAEPTYSHADSLDRAAVSGST